MNFENMPELTTRYGYMSFSARSSWPAPFSSTVSSAQGGCEAMLFSDHLILCGFGRIGSGVAGMLLSSGIGPGKIVVIDRELRRSAAAARLHLETVTGDAAAYATLRTAQLGLARELLIAAGPGTLQILRIAKSTGPSCAIRVILCTRTDRAAAYAAGADDVVLLPEVAGRLLARTVAIRAR